MHYAESVVMSVDVGVSKELEQKVKALEEVSRQVGAQQEASSAQRQADSIQCEVRAHIVYRARSFVFARERG